MPVSDFRRRFYDDPRITDRDIELLGQTDPAGRVRRDFTVGRLNRLRNRGYPIAGSFERQGRYDPREGTIGGMRLPGQIRERPTATSFGRATTNRGTGVKGLPGGLAAGTPPVGGSLTGRAEAQFSPRGIPTPTSRREAPDFGFTEQYDPFFGLAETVPEVARQFMAVANRGVLGEEGIQRLVETGIDPARARTEQMTGDILSSIRQAEGRETQAAARAMAERLPGQSGRQIRSITGQILSPSLGRQAEMAAKLQTQKLVTLNQLDAKEAGLYQKNMESKLMGLSGLGMTIDQGANIIGRRLFDPTVTNFGFTPERKAEVQSMLNKEAAAWGIEADKIGTFWNAFYQGELMKLAEELGGWKDYLDAFMPDSVSIFGGGG